MLPFSEVFCVASNRSLDELRKNLENSLYSQARLEKSRENERASIPFQYREVSAEGLVYESRIR